MKELEREFIILAVKRLFEKIKSGNIRFTDQVPETVKQVEAVRFDRAGEPVYETIGPLVRALARMAVGKEFGREVEERRVDSPVGELFDEPVAVTEEVLQACSTEGACSPLAFELYKETATVVAVCSHLYVDSGREAALPRNQAVCAGLLVRIVKFMTAVAHLISEDADRGDVVFALNRCITESATDVRFLAIKNDEQIFDQFVGASLSSEREFYDVIQKNIKARGGEILPIERRMLDAIDRVCRLSGVSIRDVDPRMRNWAGGLRSRLIAIGMGDGYPMLQRIPSHAVHGTWVDLVQHHLSEVNGDGFKPDPTWSHVDSRLMLPLCLLVLTAARTYAEVFFPRLPELEPLVARVDALMGRIMAVEEAHEAWMSGQGGQIDIREE